MSLQAHPQLKIIITLKKILFAVHVMECIGVAHDLK